MLIEKVNYPEQLLINLDNYLDFHMTMFPDYFRPGWLNNYKLCSQTIKLWAKYYVTDMTLNNRNNNRNN